LPWTRSGAGIQSKRTQPQYPSTKTQQEAAEATEEESFTTEKEEVFHRKAEQIYHKGTAAQRKLFSVFANPESAPFLSISVQSVHRSSHRPLPSKRLNLFEVGDNMVARLGGITNLLFQIHP